MKLRPAGRGQAAAWSPPAGGATNTEITASGADVVSIHAPLRGATWNSHTHILVDRVSIHAPLRGATAMMKRIVAVVAKFQSTPPCGGRLETACSPMGIRCFNPRPPAVR